jgi:hypothetical protein
MKKPLGATRRLKTSSGFYIAMSQAKIDGAALRFDRESDLREAR